MSMDQPTRCELFVWGRAQSRTLQRVPLRSTERVGTVNLLPKEIPPPACADEAASARRRPGLLPSGRGEGESSPADARMKVHRKRESSAGTRARGEPWQFHSRPKGNAAFTVIELMVSSALALLVVGSVGSLCWHSSRSFAAIANYVDLDQASQLALDKMSQEARQARRLLDFTPTSLSLLDVDKNLLQFIYDPDARTLVRVSGGETNRLLSGCDFLQFSKYQRHTISNTFDAYDPAYLTNTRLIQVTWVCSRKILGAKVNTESVQSAKIALRNN